MSFNSGSFTNRTQNPFPTIFFVTKTSLFLSHAFPCRSVPTISERCHFQELSVAQVTAFSFLVNSLHVHSKKNQKNHIPFELSVSQNVTFLILGFHCWSIPTISQWFRSLRAFCSPNYRLSFFNSFPVGPLQQYQRNPVPWRLSITQYISSPFLSDLLTISLRL